MAKKRTTPPQKHKAVARVGRLTGHLMDHMVHKMEQSISWEQIQALSTEHSVNSAYRTLLRGQIQAQLRKLFDETPEEDVLLRSVLVVMSVLTKETLK